MATSHHLRLRALLPHGAALTITLAALLAAPASHAGTIAVTTTADSGAGSLRQAISTATTGDTITLPAGTINLTGPMIPIGTKHLTLRGSGVRETALTRTGDGRLLTTAAGSSLTLERLTLRGATFGAVVSHGQVIVRDAAFTGNETPNSGAAIDADGGPVSIERSLFQNNSSANGGGVLSISAMPTVTITNSTFVSNKASYAAAWVLAAVAPATTLTATNNTFVGNFTTDASPSGVLFATATGTTSRYANNVIVGGGDPCYESPGSFNISDGGNLFPPGATDGECHFKPTDKIVADAQLGALGDHGGPVDTILPLPGSPAVGAAVAASCALLDARGATRSFGGACDAGATELIAPAATTGTPTSVTAATATLNGTIDGFGSGPLTWRLEWGTSASYGNTAPTRSAAASGPTGISEALSGLPAATTLHYRFVVITPDGTTATPDATVTTAGQPGGGAGAKTCKVPATKGLTITKAKKALKKAGCKYGSTKRVKSKSVKVGRVIGTTPAKGKQIASTTKVTLRVAKR